MRIWLGIDTATPLGSVAVAAPGAVISEEPLEERGAHARHLLSRIETLLERSGRGRDDLAGVGVAVGPGSFTGVRVGMATAKGLSYALGIGVAGLSTLEAMARAALRGGSPPPPAIAAVLEAGRGEVYAALFRTGTGRPERLRPDRSLPPEALPADLPPGCVLVGDGAAAVVRAASTAGRVVPPPWPTPLLAGAIALWAMETIPPGTVYTPGGLGPNYVRPSDAEAARRRS
jgi:tRNA threonylcarbamoyladenosine biosynthesis protein TsaB